MRDWCERMTGSQPEMLQAPQTQVSGVSTSPVCVADTDLNVSQVFDNAHPFSDVDMHTEFDLLHRLPFGKFNLKGVRARTFPTVSVTDGVRSEIIDKYVVALKDMGTALYTVRPLFGAFGMVLLPVVLTFHAQVCCSDTVDLVDSKILTVTCSVLTFARKMLQMIEKGNKVPSHTLILTEMMLDVFSENKKRYPLPDADMFKDTNGDYTFAVRIAPYLHHFSCRVRANLCNNVGDGPGTNTKNTVENINKLVHKDFPARRGTQAHVHDLLDGTHNFSLQDRKFGDEMRRDMHHHDTWIAVMQALQLTPYAHFPEIKINLMHCALTTRLSHGQSLPRGRGGEGVGFGERPQNCQQARASGADNSNFHGHSAQ